MDESSFNLGGLGNDVTGQRKPSASDSESDNIIHKRNQEEPVKVEQTEIQNDNIVEN